MTLANTTQPVQAVGAGALSSAAGEGATSRRDEPRSVMGDSLEGN